jgi:dienelactone hydrolase
MLPSLFLALTAMTPAADPSPADTAKADEAIHRYLAAEAKRLSERFMDGAKSKAEWEAKRPKLKEQFLDMLGLWPLPEKTPLKATVTGTLERGDVTIEKLHFQSKPGLYVTGNLYKPKASLPRKRGEPSPKLPAILYVCGHSGRGRDGNKTAFQDHGMWFASNGYVCLVVDTLQLGEVAGKHHGTYNLNRFWWQDRGYTPAGVECWNGIRGIDYLISRPDVDPERIGVTGISGGGATTVWVAAADDRVKVAVPVSGMSDLESYVSNKVINGHCDCMFFINTYQWEWTTALALHAPKPLLFANSDNDTIFPMDGNRRIIERLRKCYDLLGKKENVDEYVSKGGHDYRPDLRLAIFGFLNKHLKNDTSPIKDADFAKIEGKDLRVFPEDKDLPKDQINDRVDELFVPKAEVKLPTTKEEFAAWKAGLVKKLRETSVRTLPEKVPPAKQIREEAMNGAKLTMSAEEGIEFVADLDFSVVGENKTTLIVVNPDEAFEEATKSWDDRYRKDTFVWGLVSSRGGHGGRWTRKNPPNTVERSLALLGQTVDTGRIRDVAAYLSPLPKEEKEPSRLRVVARGQAGIIAAYALLLSPRPIHQLVILDPPTSHRDGPHFLNVDRVLDLPTALGLLAPDVKLTLINAKDPAFDKTAAIYKLAGAADKFERK